MIQEAYCSFEVAKLLNEKGFDEECYTFYEYDSKEFYREEKIPCCNSCSDDYAAPTLQMAIAWLREMYHWHISVTPRWVDVEYMPGEWEETMVGYQYVIINVGEVTRKDKQPITTALSPESAYEAALKYTLENLI